MKVRELAHDSTGLKVTGETPWEGIAVDHETMVP
jgi:hypothetical protein